MIGHYLFAFELGFICATLLATYIVAKDDARRRRDKDDQ